MDKLTRLIVSVNNALRDFPGRSLSIRPSYGEGGRGGGGGGEGGEEERKA